MWINQRVYCSYDLAFRRHFCHERIGCLRQSHNGLKEANTYCTTSSTVLQGINGRRLPGLNVTRLSKSD